MSVTVPDRLCPGNASIDTVVCAPILTKRTSISSIVPATWTTVGSTMAMAATPSDTSSPSSIRTLVTIPSQGAVMTDSASCWWAASRADLAAATSPSLRETTRGSAPDRTSSSFSRRSSTFAAASATFLRLWSSSVGSGPASRSASSVSADLRLAAASSAVALAASTSAWSGVVNDTRSPSAVSRLAVASSNFALA